MTAFFKVSGSGNDFVALADPAADPTPETIRAWCKRGVSLGADGVFALRRAGGEAVAMTYWNADGNPAELCLNGTRCAAQLAFHLGWAADDVAVHTTAGPFRAHRVDSRRVALDLGDLETTESAPRELTADVDGQSWSGFSVPVGVPHFLLPWSGDLDAAPVVSAGRPLRHHARFQPAGTNVSFVQYAGEHQAAIRTYERGVEDETLSCGTGVVAAARLGVALGQVAFPVVARTRGGFELTVDRDPVNRRFTLAGDARVVACGELLEGAA
jgi:diaminopimelate epimerase